MPPDVCVGAETLARPAAASEEDRRLTSSGDRGRRPRRRALGNDGGDAVASGLLSGWILGDDALSSALDAVHGFLAGATPLEVVWLDEHQQPPSTFDLESIVDLARPVPARCVTPPPRRAPSWESDPGRGYARRMAEVDGKPLDERLEEIGAQLAWVRDYL